MNNLIAFFTDPYRDLGLQLKTKSRILTIVNLIFCPTCLILGLILIATKATISGASLFTLLLGCGGSLALLRHKHYGLASTATLFGLFLVMFAAIKFDAYQNIYECYVFGTLGSFLLIITSLVGDRPGQSALFTALNLAAIFILYFFDSYLNPNVDNKVVTSLAIQSLATSSLIVIIGGVCSAFIVQNSLSLIQSLETSALSAKKSYKNLNEAMMGAQATSQKIGEQLSGSVEHTVASVKALQETVSGIVEGMDRLAEALRESENANTSTVTNQNTVRETLAAYSREVAHASSAIEEMAAAVATIGGQANQKGEAVRGLVGLAKAGEERLSEIKISIDRILQSAQSMMEMSVFIEDVAERTNLLGLNASIEAAHAGATGKGFAVVADQIRALSVEAGKSSRNISETLKDTRDAIQATARQNQEVIAFFKKISEDTQGVSSMFEELLYSIKEISGGSEDVLRAVESVSALTTATEQTVNNSHESIHKSSEGIGQVTTIASKVRNASIEMVGRFGEMLHDAENVQRLGQENLETVESLKLRINAGQRAE
jgi:methyl-accepting chemotaxis protein